MDFCVAFLAAVLWGATGLRASDQVKDTTCPTHIPNGILSRNCTGYIGSYCLVSCNHGYRLNDDVLGIYCNKDRKWSVIQTKICQQADETGRTRVSSSTEAVLWGAAAGFLSVCLTYIVVMMVKQKIKKLNDSDSFSIHPRPAEVTRGNDYLETVAFVQPTSHGDHQSNRSSEEVANKTEVKMEVAKKLSEDKAPVQLNRKQNYHLYHNVFRTGSYENV